MRDGDLTSRNLFMGEVKNVVYCRKARLDTLWNGIRAVHLEFPLVVVIHIQKRIDTY